MKLLCVWLLNPHITSRERETFAVSVTSRPVLSRVFAFFFLIVRTVCTEAMLCEPFCNSKIKSDPSSEIQS